MSNMEMPGAVVPADLTAVLAGTAHPAVLVAQTLLSDLMADLLVGLVINDDAHDRVRTILARSPDVLEEAIDATAEEYGTWREHPRLGHEALISEVRAADASFNRALTAVLNVAAGRDGLFTAAARFAQFKLLLASIRVIAILKVVGFDRAMAAKPKSGRKSGKRSRKNALPRGGHPIGPQHLSEEVGNRVIVLSEALGTDREAEALGKLDALRGTSEDKDAVVTKLVVMAHQAPERIAALAKSLDQATGTNAPSAAVEGTMEKVQTAKSSSTAPHLDAEEKRFLQWLEANGRKIAYLLKRNGDAVIFGTPPNAASVKSWVEQFASTPEVQRKLRTLHEEYECNSSGTASANLSN